MFWSWWMSSVAVATTCRCSSSPTSSRSRPHPLSHFVLLFGNFSPSSFLWDFLNWQGSKACKWHGFLDGDFQMCKRRVKVLNSKSPAHGAKTPQKAYKHLCMLPFSCIKRVVDIFETPGTTTALSNLSIEHGSGVYNLKCRALKTSFILKPRARSSAIALWSLYGSFTPMGVPFSSSSHLLAGWPVTYHATSLCCRMQMCLHAHYQKNWWGGEAVRFYHCGRGRQERWVSDHTEQGHLCQHVPSRLCKWRVWAAKKKKKKQKTRSVVIALSLSNSVTCWDGQNWHVSRFWNL